MNEQYNGLLQKANTLKDEIVTLENHIEAGRQFQGEDMYEVLMGTTESILEKKRQELSTIISKLKEMKANIENY